LKETVIEDTSEDNAALSEGRHCFDGLSRPMTSLYVLTFSKLQLVKDGGFTGGIETNHKDSHFLLAELYS
jgi:hypothetical protein